MLATAGPAPTGPGWAMEVKWDGVRIQLRHDGASICLRTRPGRRCTEEFPELDDIRGQLGRRRVILDGELVCLGPDGKADFAASGRAWAVGSIAPGPSSGRS
jgi:bifunctional non-homologous end joining protein LigD